MHGLIQEIEKEGGVVKVENGNLKLRFPKGYDNVFLIEKIKEHKTELITFLQAMHVGKDSIAPLSKPQDDYAVSDAQRRLWLLSQYGEASTAYHMFARIELNHSTFDVAVFRKAFDAVVGRHEILRTIFKMNPNGELRQVIIPAGAYGCTLLYHDCRDLEAKTELVNRYIEEDKCKPFDLEKGPLLRACLYHLENDRLVFYYNMHHIISDAWSVHVLTKDILAYYESYRQNVEAELPDLNIQYKDYASWQLSTLDTDESLVHKKFWLEKLTGDLPVLNLFSYKLRPRMKTYAGQILCTYLSVDTSDKLKEFCSRHKGSVFMGVLASFNVLFYRYTSNQDIIIGTPVSGRDNSDLEHQIGFFVNTLALRNQIHADDTWSMFFEKVRESTLDSFAHQSYPFDRLVDELNLQTDSGRSVLFDVMLAFQNVESITSHVDNHRNGSEDVVCLGTGSAKFDLTIQVEEQHSQLCIVLNYNTDVYDKDTMENLLVHYKRLLLSMLENPEIKVSEIDFLSSEEKQKLLVDFNDSYSNDYANRSIVDLFQEQVAATPNKTALVCDNNCLSYKGLNEKSNRFANYLIKKYNLKQNEYVAILLSRSEELMVAILAVLKSGAAYVPIDPSYPLDRIKWMTENSNAGILITEKEFRDFYSAHEKYESADIGRVILPNDLAYVMYTSGSTGTPKGVMIKHKSVVRLVKSSNYIKLTGDEVLLSTGSISFDATTFEYWSMLLNGGQLVICSQECLMDVKKLQQEIVQKQIDTMWFTSGWLNQLVDVSIGLFNNLKTILVGGDTLSPSHIYILKSHYPDLTVINGYGPTENTTFSLAYTVAEPLAAIPLGKPINNTTAYILSNHRQLMPIGSVGEIYLGGDGLARGYLNRPELTAERFVENPFVDGALLYKTGDLGRWTKDGNIEFLGRMDEQVKIRGYRIELGEVEYALKQIDGIDEAVVLAKSNLKGEKELLAYWVSTKYIYVSDIRSVLRESLPEYMVPVSFTQLDVMPLTSNGKIDRRALANLDTQLSNAGVAYVEARNDLQLAMIGIWESILDKRNIGIKVNFFESGGHSLKAIRLISKIEKELGSIITLRDLFDYPTIEKLSERIQLSDKIASKDIELLETKQFYDLSHAQMRVWALSQREEASLAFNMPMAILIEGDLDRQAFHQSFKAMVNRHESLRTVFVHLGDCVKQKIVPVIESTPVQMFDLTGMDDYQVELDELIRKEWTLLFDLENGPLYRFKLIVLGERKTVFLFTMHHIISDDLSQHILWNEFVDLYSRYKKDREFKAEPLRIHYKEFAAWQNQQIESTSRLKDFWMDTLADKPPVAELPLDRERPVIMTYRGGVVHWDMDESMTTRVRDLVKAEDGTLFMFFVAITNLMIFKYTRQTDVTIGTPIANRQHAELENQVGFYLNTIVLRTNFGKTDSFTHLLRKVKDVCINAYDHQLYPFNKLIEDLGVERDVARHPLFDLMLDMTSFKRQHNEPLDDLVITSLQKDSTNCKFDLTLYVYENIDRINLTFEYNVDLFDQDTIELMRDSFSSCIEKVLDDLNAEVKDIVIDRNLTFSSIGPIKRNH